MAKKIYGFSKEDLRKQEAYNQRVRGRAGSTQRQRVKQRRGPRGGGRSGSTIAHGYLVKEVPATSYLDDAVEVWEFFAGSETEEGGFSPVGGEEGGDEEEQLVLKAYNTSKNSVVRGSALEKVWVTGEIKNVFLSNPDWDDEDEESPQYITERVFFIYANLDPLAIAEGFVKSPDNNKGQALMHRDGIAATIADGAPCGETP